ncbi:hypothetical protein ANN_26847 [Periplaneta americana]|uniref:Uncharacterized protein n=1 Tax=Periplaneta americana TaxID=6978 RepID=A0ABQ8RZ70_PERAM|nr:hypothetical protein ANN_26847 [Periplaneta americana]
MESSSEQGSQSSRPGFDARKTPIGKTGVRRAVDRSWKTGVRYAVNLSESVTVAISRKKAGKIERKIKNDKGNGTEDKQKDREKEKDGKEEGKEYRNDGRWKDRVWTSGWLVVKVRPEPSKARLGGWYISAESGAPLSVADPDSRLVYRQFGESVKFEASIGEANIILANPKLKSDLAFIKANFEKLPVYITKLETSSFPLHSAVQVMKKVEIILKEIPSSVEEAMRNKYFKIVKRNPGWEHVLLVAEALVANDIDVTAFPLVWSPADIESLKYCPIRSCEVERSFSQFKNILTDNRNQFSLQHLEEYLVIHCHNGITIESSV